MNDRGAKWTRTSTLADTYLHPPARHPLVSMDEPVCCRLRTQLQAGPSSSPEHNTQSFKPPSRGEKASF